MKSVLFIICSFFLISCGTTGHIQFYNFQESRLDVEKEFDNFIKKNSSYVVPVKWNDIYKNPGPMKYLYIYFQSNPEEMYQIGFTDYYLGTDAKKSQLGLIGFFNGDHWEYRNEMSYAQMRRVRTRFEDEILNQLKISYDKSN